MPSFTEIRKGLAGNMGLFFGHGVNGDTGAAQKSVELAAAAILLVCASTTIASSTKVAAETRHESAWAMACAYVFASVSLNRIAMIADVSMIIWEDHARRRAGLHDRRAFL